MGWSSLCYLMNGLDLMKSRRLGPICEKFVYASNVEHACSLHAIDSNKCFTFFDFFLLKFHEVS